MPSISSFNIISVFVPDPNIFFCIQASAVDVAAVNRNGIKTLLVNVLITFFINSSPVFNNELRSLPRNPAHCIILEKLVFNNLLSIDELFAKTL